MKVKIGDRIYDPEQEPIMIILTEKDKQNIANMAVGYTKYCVFPGGTDHEMIDRWMDDDAGNPEAPTVKANGN